VPTPRRKRAHKPDRVRALELLASSGAEGCTEATLRAHGVTIPQMVELVRDGLATASGERMVAGGKSINVTRVRITSLKAKRASLRRAAKGGT
jgi:hypothetical protein